MNRGFVIFYTKNLHLSSQNSGTKGAFNCCCDSFKPLGINIAYVSKLLTFSEINLPSAFPANSLDA